MREIYIIAAVYLHPNFSRSTLFFFSFIYIFFFFLLAIYMSLYTLCTSRTQRKACISPLFNTNHTWMCYNCGNQRPLHIHTRLNIPVMNKTCMSSVVALYNRMVLLQTSNILYTFIH